jgi:hypothetical protein
VRALRDVCRYLAAKGASAADKLDGAPRIAQLFQNITVNADLCFDETDKDAGQADDADAAGSSVVFVVHDHPTNSPYARLLILWHCAVSVPPTICVCEWYMICLLQVSIVNNHSFYDLCMVLAPAAVTDWDKVYASKIDSDDEADEQMELQFPEDDDAPLTLPSLPKKGEKKRLAAQHAAAAAAVTSSRPNKRKASADGPVDAANFASSTSPVSAGSVLPPQKRTKVAHTPSLSTASVAAAVIPAAVFLPTDGARTGPTGADAAVPDRTQLKKLKKKMAKQAELAKQSELQLPKYEVNPKEGAGKVEYDSDDDARFFKHRTGHRDLNKLNTMRPKPTAPFVRRTNETTQKRISLNRRKTRMCV